MASRRSDSASWATTRARPLLLLTFLRFTDTLGVATFVLLLPEIRDYFGVSITRVQIVVTIAALLPLLISVPDRLPLRPGTALGPAGHRLRAVRACSRSARRSRPG